MVKMAIREEAHAGAKIDDQVERWGLTYNQIQWVRRNGTGRDRPNRSLVGLAFSGNELAG